MKKKLQNSNGVALFGFVCLSISALVDQILLLNYLITLEGGKLCDSRTYSFST